MKEVTLQWLEDMAAELDRQGVGSNLRAEQAEKTFRKEFVVGPKSTEDFNAQWNHLNQQIEKIHSFFLTQTNKDRGYICAQFTGIYYFFGEFWKFSIPLVMGQRRLHAFKYLEMPFELQKRLASDVNSVKDYAGVFFDSVDYGYGIEEVERRCPNNLSKQLFRSGDKHLHAARALLCQQQASSKAIEDARMAIEIFLKAFIVAHDGLTDDELRRQFSHDLDRLADRCIVLGLTDLGPVKNKIVALPDVQTRYDAKERTFGELWGAYRVALAVGVAVLRPLTGRDCRPDYPREVQ